MMTENHESILGEPVNGFDASDTIGGRISRAREAGGYSLAQLARRLGVKTTTLKMWETDRSEPRSNRLAMLAAFLNVSPTWLLVGKGESPSANTLSDEIGLLEMELVAIQSGIMSLNQKLADTIARMQVLKSKEAEHEEEAAQPNDQAA